MGLKLPLIHTIMYLMKYRYNGTLSMLTIWIQGACSAGPTGTHLWTSLQSHICKIIMSLKYDQQAG